MDLKAVENNFRLYFDMRAIFYDTEYKKDCVIFSSRFLPDGYDGKVRLVVAVTVSGSLIFTLIFGKFSDDKRALRVVNEFNRAQSIFKAYVNEIGRLEISHCAFDCGDEFGAERLLAFLLDKLTDKDSERYIKPLVRLTDI